MEKGDEELRNKESSNLKILFVFVEVRIVHSVESVQCVDFQAF